MSHFTFVLFAGLLTVYAAMAQPHCPENATWIDCGAACHRTCENPNPKICQECLPGCVCIQDFVFNDEGKCVTIDECP